MRPVTPKANGADDGGMRDVAARWVVRQDRRLTPAEEVELAAWLAADPGHAAALKQATASWQRLRGIAAAVRRTPAEVAPPKATWNWAWVGGLAAAAALVLAISLREASGPKAAHPTTASHATSAHREPAARRFADGSVAHLKEGAEIVEAYSATERRIRLVRGEAFFTVTKDPARPFFVEVDRVTVRAVGTAFAVRRESLAVNVLVTEGTVKVTPVAPASAQPEEESSALVAAGHRAVVTQTPEPRAARVSVTAVSTQDIAQSLAWKNTMLDFADTMLSDVVAAFSQRTGRQIEIGDPALATVRIGGQFPTDDIDGFVRALEEIYDVKAEKRADGSIVLRKAR